MTDIIAPDAMDAGRAQFGPGHLLLKAANVLFRYSPLLLLALVWQAATSFGWVSTAVLPPLSGVLSSGYDMILSADFWDNTGSSLYRGGIGLLLAIVIGGALGIGMAWWRPMRYLFSP